MDIERIRQVLDEAAQMDLDEAIRYLADALYEPDEISWEVFDDLILCKYKTNREEVTPKTVKTWLLILGTPKKDLEEGFD